MMTFWEHLNELRIRILYIILSIIFFSLISLQFIDQIYYFLLKPIDEFSDQIKVQVLGVPTIFYIQLILASFGGIILSIPTIIFNVIKFIIPAINNSKKHFIMYFISIFIMMFLGMFFSYFVVVPFSLDFFISMKPEFADVELNFTLSRYLKFIVWMILSFGISFQLPAVIFLSSQYGWINYNTLIKNRKYVIMVLLILGALITPPDPVSLLMLFFPMYLLFECSILVVYFFR